MCSNGIKLYTSGFRNKTTASYACHDGTRCEAKGIWEVEYKTLICAPEKTLCTVELKPVISIPLFVVGGVGLVLGGGMQLLAAFGCLVCVRFIGEKEDFV